MSKLALVHSRGHHVPIPSKKVKDHSDFYAKYPHVVPGSIREPTKADQKVLPHVHKLVCDVRCTHPGCSVVRPRNTQDVFQSKFCKEHCGHK